MSSDTHLNFVQMSVFSVQICDLTKSDDYLTDQICSGSTNCSSTDNDLNYDITPSSPVLT